MLIVQQLPEIIPLEFIDEVVIVLNCSLIEILRVSSRLFATHCNVC